MGDYYPPYASDVECWASSFPITLGTPIVGALPVEWTLSCAVSAQGLGDGALTWANVCGILQFADGTVEVVLPSGYSLDSKQAAPPQAEITVVYRAKSENGQPTLSLYFDSLLEASISGPFGEFGGNPGVVEMVNASIAAVRIFSKAIDPASEELFWFDEPTAPLPAGLVAAYDLYTVPAVDRVSGQTLSAVSGDQMLIAGGRIWNDPNGDTPATTNFSPGTGGGGLTIQAQVFTNATNVADFIIARVVGPKHSLTFSIGNTGVVHVEYDGHEFTQVNIPLAGWCNLAVSVSQQGFTVFVNGVSMITSSTTTFDDFGATTSTQIGGWYDAPGSASNKITLQSISFFSAPLNASEISSFLYAPPTSDPRCIGFFVALDGASLINMKTGDAATLSAAGGYQRFSVPSDKYFFPPLASLPSPVAVRPLERPDVDVAWTHAQWLVATTGAGLAAGSREARLAAVRLAAGLRVAPSGDLVLIGQVLVRETDGVVKFDLVIPQGLIEIEGLAVAVVDPCTKWLALFVLNAVMGFFGAVTAVPRTTAQMTEYFTAFLRDNGAVQYLREWLGSQGGGDVDYQQYMTLAKGLYTAGSGATAIWNYFEALNWYDRGRAMISMGLTVTAIFVPAAPPAWVVITRLAAQLTLTLANLSAQLKQRPSGCPSAEFEPGLFGRRAFG